MVGFNFKYSLKHVKLALNRKEKIVLNETKS